MVGGIDSCQDADLSQVVGTNSPLRTRRHALESRQEQCRQHRDNCDDDEKFDQGEPSVAKD